MLDAAYWFLPLPMWVLPVRIGVRQRKVSNICNLFNLYKGTSTVRSVYFVFFNTTDMKVNIDNKVYERVLTEMGVYDFFMIDIGSTDDTKSGAKKRAIEMNKKRTFRGFMAAAFHWESGSKDGRGVSFWNEVAMVGERMCNSIVEVDSFKRKYGISK